MEKHKFIPYEKYKDAGGRLYQVLCIARHFKTGEELVIYQTLFGDNLIYAGSTSEFMEILDIKETNEKEYSLDPDVEEFLDADTYEKRVEILSKLSGRVDDDMIDIMSTVIDVEIPEGPVQKRYDRFMDALITRRHYEVNRLR